MKNAQNVFLNLLLSILLHLQFYQTGYDELEIILHRFYVWLVYQRKPSPYTKSFLNLANAFLCLNLSVARVNFVQKVLNAKIVSPLILTGC